VRVKRSSIIASKFELISDTQISGLTFIYLQLDSPKMRYYIAFLVLYKSLNNSYT
jgi:hypothetical protein